MAPFLISFLPEHRKGHKDEDVEKVKGQRETEMDEASGSEIQSFLIVRSCFPPKRPDNTGVCVDECVPVSPEPSCHTPRPVCQPSPAGVHFSSAPPVNQSGGTVITTLTILLRRPLLSHAVSVSVLKKPFVL